MHLSSLVGISMQYPLRPMKWDSNHWISWLSKAQQKRPWKCSFITSKLLAQALSQYCFCQFHYQASHSYPSQKKKVCITLSKNFQRRFWQMIKWFSVCFAICLCINYSVLSKLISVTTAKGRRITVANKIIFKFWHNTFPHFLRCLTQMYLTTTKCRVYSGIIDLWMPYLTTQQNPKLIKNCVSFQVNTENLSKNSSLLGGKRKLKTTLRSLKEIMVLLREGREQESSLEQGCCRRKEQR